MTAVAEPGPLSSRVVARLSGAGTAPYRRRMGLSAPALATGLGMLAIATLPVLLVWVLVRINRISQWVVAVLRRCRVLPKENRTIPRPPVERLAADLRRLSAASRNLPHGTPYARHKGLLLAYDDTLVAACQALDVPQSLDTLPLGTDRELERLRVEAALEAAGLRISVPRDHQDTP